MKIVLVLLPFVVGLLGIVLTLVVGGSLMPRDHVASVRAKFSRPPAEIFATISDFAGSTTWRRGLTRMEPLPDRNGKKVWKEVGGKGDGMSYEITELVPESRMVTTIADDSLPFGGTWTYDVTPDGPGAILTLTENGFIRPTPFRYIAAILGLDATMRRYLMDLGAHFGESVRIEAVPTDKAKV